MSYKKTILQLQRMLIEADAEVELEQVDASKLEPGCEATDLLILNEAEFLRENPPVGSIIELLGSIVSQEFKDDGSNNYWEGYPSDKKPGRVVIGVDTIRYGHEDTPYVRIEEQGPEFLAQFDEEKKMQTFKEFLTEARKAGVDFQEERTKGKVTKVIAQLEGHDAGRLTKLAREYHKLSKALDKIEKAKTERNAQLKALIGDTFDSEADKFYTRVMASATFTATLAKETHPDDVAEKIEIAYEKLVDGLIKLIATELQPAAEELIEACTRKWKPDPRSPNLSVKPLDEGMAALAVSAVTSWWRGIKTKLAKHLARFDKGLPKLEAQLATYKAMPKPSLGEEGAKANRKHPAITTVEGQMGKFKTFMNEPMLTEMAFSVEKVTKLKELVMDQLGHNDDLTFGEKTFDEWMMNHDLGDELADAEEEIGMYLLSMAKSESERERIENSLERVTVDMFKKYYKAKGQW